MSVNQKAAAILNKPFHKRLSNRILAGLATILPGATTVRPFLHRLRGCHIGSDCFIGDRCYLENEYPECISIGDHSALAPDCMLIAHVGRTDRKQGPLSGQIIIGSNVFVGARSFIAAGPDNVVNIGDGSCIGACCCIVNRDIQANALVTVPPILEIGVCSVPLTAARSYFDFVRGIHPIRNPNKFRKRRDSTSRNPNNADHHYPNPNNDEPL